MTSESNPPGMPESPQRPEPTPAPATPSPMSEAMSDAKSAMGKSGFSTPQGMVALGGLLVIGADIVFSLLLNQYGVSYTHWVLAAIAVLLFFGKKELFEKVAPVPVLMKLTGYLLGLMGAVDLVYDLRFFDGTLNEFPDVLGAAVAYAGYALAFIGARSIKT